MSAIRQARLRESHQRQVIAESIKAGFQSEIDALREQVRQQIIRIGELESLFPEKDREIGALNTKILSLESVIATHLKQLETFTHDFKQATQG